MVKITKNICAQKAKITKIIALIKEKHAICACNAFKKKIWEH